ncbi:MAG: hypothetical protein HZA52_14180 [Planctomycetes bacterium]|nr:hypothetical protein [Planctomycetota bacterium]
MKLVVGIVVAAWTVALLVAFVAWSWVGRGDSGAWDLPRITSLVAIANIVVFASGIVVGLLARGGGRAPLPVGRFRTALGVVIGTLFFVAALSTWGVFGNSRELGSLLVNVAAQPVGIWILVLHVERMQRRRLVHA